MTSSRLTGINYKGLNELINIIHNFMNFWGGGKLYFPEKPFLLHSDLEQVNKVHLCKQG